MDETRIEESDLVERLVLALESPDLVYI